MVLVEAITEDRLQISSPLQKLSVMVEGVDYVATVGYETSHKFIAEE